MRGGGMEAGRDWAYEGAVAQLEELQAGPGAPAGGAAGPGGGGSAATELLRELLSAASAEDAARLAAARLSRGRGPGASGGSPDALEPAAGPHFPQIFYQRTPAPPGVWGLDPTSALRSYEERYGGGALGGLSGEDGAEAAFEPIRAQYLGAREALRRFADRRLARDMWRTRAGESGSEYSADLDSFFE